MLKTHRKMRAAALIVGAGLMLSGCVQSRLHVADDFGQTVRQDIAAQIADPDARYKGVPEPGSAGRRVGAAQDRYQTGTVIQPASTSTSTASSGGSSGP